MFFLFFFFSISLSSTSCLSLPTPILRLLLQHNTPSSSSSQFLSLKIAAMSFSPRSSSYRTPICLNPSFQTHLSALVWFLPLLKEEHVRFGSRDAAENSEYNRHAVRRIKRRREENKKRKSATGNIILGQKLLKSKSSSSA
jgi:hypothetical protein